MTTAGTERAADDRAWLERAAALGRRGWGSVRPNPLVGCVLVEDGAVVGEGWHAEVGGPHAEVVALEQAGEAARGSTAYVSLEPCRHTGRTPPCTDALVRAGVGRVVFGATDPTGEAGGGADVLRAAGVEVSGPHFSRDRAREENPAFFHWAERGRPWVAVKLAQTLDGRISRPGAQTRITGDAAEQWVHALRAGFDAVLVGSATARTDDPRLTVRGEVVPLRQPARLIADTGARLSPQARVFEDIGEAPVHVFVAEDAPAERCDALATAGARVHRISRVPDGVDPAALVSEAAACGYRSVLCEGGGALAASLVRAGVVERLHVLVSPWVLGEDGVPGFRGPVGREAWEGWSVARARATVEPDALITFRREY